LTGEGTLFERAYSYIPLCVPSRAALLTGSPPELTEVCPGALMSSTFYIVNEYFLVAWEGVAWNRRWGGPQSPHGLLDSPETWLLDRILWFDMSTLPPVFARMRGHCGACAQGSGTIGTKGCCGTTTRRLPKEMHRTPRRPHFHAVYDSILQPVSAPIG